MLRIHVREEWCPKGTPHVPLLAPFWGIFPGHPASPRLRGFRDYEARGADFFELTSVKNANCVLLPFDWHYATTNARTFALAERVREVARSNGKLLLVFFFGDSDEAVPFDEAIVFRTSLNRGQRANEFAHPAWADDIVGKVMGDQLPLRPKLDVPIVGFRGFAGYRMLPSAPLRRQVRSVIRWVYRGMPSSTVRERAIGVLNADHRIVTQFELQENFFAGVLGSNDEERFRLVRTRFVSNMLGSDYALTARGGGNYSYRFYEALSLARPLVFLDTRCVFPYEFKIDYQSLGVFLDESEITEVGNRLVAFHEGLTSEDFLDLQHRCRQVWEEYLSPTGFFKNLHSYLERN